jgi:MerR family mercuric resistance operon transcriptional regulator
VASRTGVSIQAVRLYERRGLLKKPTRLPSGYRDYPSDALAFIRFIKRAQGHGFTLDEIRSLIHLREQSPPAAKQMRGIAKAKLAILDERIKRLQAQRDAIAHGLNRCQCSEEFPMCMFVRLVDQGK